MTTRVAIAGATGKLGRYAAELVEQAYDLELVARLDSSSPLEAMLDAEVLLDVTLPVVSPQVVGFAIEHDLKVLVGTSGWSSERLASLDRQVSEHPASGVIVIPNFSLGSALATAFAAQAARFFESIEIVEAHGAGKVDSPSGTAVRTAELIALARRDLGPVAAPHVDQRARGQQVASVPVHSLRMTGTIARQSVLFGGPGETLTIEHDTVSSEAYRAGILLALRAAATASGLTVGLESLVDLSPSVE